MPWRIMAVVVLGAMLVSAMVASTRVAAQEQAQVQEQACTNCLRYAGTELNLRQEPNLEGAVLRFVPKGAAVQLTGEAVQNGYAPVTYDRVPGWVVALGLVATPEEVQEFMVPDAAATPMAGAVAASGETRLTLSALLLRSGPAVDAAPILTMPEGATVTLTREGAQNGYVTVDYGGVTGWAYADLLAAPGEA